MTAPPRLQGVLSPVVTPFDRDLRPDGKRLAAHCRWLVDGDCGLAVFGTNSEANSMSVAEKMTLLDTLIESGLSPARMMPGTGCSAYTDSIELTRHAVVRHGCAGVLMLPPFYYKAVSDEGLFRAYARIIEGVGDERLRIYLYHIPPVANVPITLTLIERLLKEFPGTVAGIKDSSGDWNNMKAMLERFQPQGFDVFAGSETFLLATLRAGGVGCITATGNVNPGAIARLARNWQDADADEQQKKLDAVRAVFQKFPVIPAMKAAIAHFGGDADWALVRPPLVELDSAQRAALIAELEAVGFTISGLRMSPETPRPNASAAEATVGATTPQSPTSAAAAPRGMRKGLTSYGDTGFSLFLRKAFIKGAGFTDDALGRPVIGIANTGSAYNPCHGNAAQLVEAVKRGVMLHGGLPMDFPTVSIHESFAAPTSMYLRNLMSMDTEEMIRAQPMDAVVLIGGCDKTVPAQLMGAASAGVPAIQLVTGAMLTGSYRAERVGACTDCRRFWAKYRAEEVDDAEIAEINDQLVASVGTCSVMGTASTMACLVEALGMMPLGSATPPAVTADRIRVAEQTGAIAVQMAKDGLTPEKILTGKAFENAFRVLLAIGGSTNGLIHLTAIAGRLGIEIDLDRVDAMGNDTPVLIDLKPSGQYYMEDFHKAGGMPTLLRELKPLLHLDAMTVTGRTLGEELARTGDGFPQEVVRSRKNPIYPRGGIAVLRGNLAPGGAIIKQSAADAKLMEHEGRAVVFENVEDLGKRIDDDALDVTADDILVLKNIGPKGAPGMPEAGYLPIPKKLARAGVKDLVRISDGRMSGTAAGTIVLHVTPESAIGGPLALVRNGDRIRLSVGRRELSLLVSESELATRAKAQAVSLPPAGRGYQKLFQEHVTQADQGVDFDFLRAAEFTEKVPQSRSTAS